MILSLNATNNLGNHNQSVCTTVNVPMTNHASINVVKILALYPILVEPTPSVILEYTDPFALVRSDGWEILK